MKRNGAGSGPRRGPVGLWITVLAIAGGAGPGPDDRPRPEDDGTFRPTVLVREGLAQGSGTVIASVKGETLVLTAAHVVKGRGRPLVELHRYNLGVEGIGPREGWPVAVEAEVAGADEAADIAILRVRRLPALPYVARLAASDDEPARGTLVTSVGIDLGTHLSSWQARVVEVAWFEMDGGAERPFLITTKTPEFGRSGGGLFLEDGTLVGVCIGRAHLYERRRSGIFASAASIRQLLRDAELDAAVVRSEARHRAVTRRARPTDRAPIVTTRSRSAP